MRILSAIHNDIRFQIKYGFYLLYLVISMIYIGIIFALPTSMRGMVSAVVAFSDPSALGLFFMGAIILFEKSERVLNSLFISPLTIDEYILGKVVSLSIIATAVGIAIVLTTGTGKVHLLPLVSGLILGSILFSLTGLIIAARVNSLNQFMIGVIPLGSLLSLPSFLILFGFDNIFLRLHPGVIVLKLILNGVGIVKFNWFQILMLIFWIAIFWIWARVNVRKMISTLGGVRL